MSWFDSSFTFAKTALSTAQKSIDRVLDIDDQHPDGLEQQGIIKVKGPKQNTYTILVKLVSCVLVLFCC